MIIRKINDNTIRCIISQEDLKENEIDLDDLLEHKPRAMEYLHSIVMEAAKDENFRFEGPFTSMQVRVLRDNSICLTLTQGLKPDLLRELHDAAAKLKESLQDSETAGTEVCAKEISESAELLSGEENGSGEALQESAARRDTVYSLMFDFLEEAVQICQSVPLTSHIDSDLYLDQDHHVYYLFFRIGEDEVQFEKVLLAVNEFGTFLELPPQTAAYMMEHFQCILKGNAAAQLALL